jgi:hypothetical protein
MTEQIMKVDGACHCGEITYEAVIDPSRAAVCHCTDCQTFTGSAFRAIVPAQAESFRLKGQPSIYYKTGDSGVRRAQAFCPTCGTSLYSCAADNPSSYNLRLGGLRQRRDIPALKQIWRGSALEWALHVKDLETVDQTAGYVEKR